MPSRIIIGLIVIAAVVEGLWPGVVPQNILPLALVALGLAYAAIAIDAEDATAYLVVAVAVGAASQAEVLDNIHLGTLQVIGSSLDDILDHVAIALYGGVVTVIVMRTWNRLMPSDSE